MIEYQRAADVRSPAQKWALEKVVHDRGERLFAVALGTWDYGEGPEPRLALRWNGSAEHPAGSPTSHGHATWFILPDEFAVGVAERTLRLILAEASEDAAERARLLVKWLETKMGA